jgi:methylglutaconyl-CoA hydratase
MTLPHNSSSWKQTDSEQPTIVRATHCSAETSIVFTGTTAGNLLPYAGMVQLIAALEEAHRGNSLLLTISAQGPDFCTGRSQKETVPGLSRKESLSLILRVNELLTSFPGISVSSVHGQALGFGSGLATQCDITLAEISSVFGFDEVSKGLAPLVVAEYLPKYIGRRRAYDLVLTGRLLSGSEAASYGIVSRLVPDGSLISSTAALRDHLVSLEPGALRLLKSYFQRVDQGKLRDAQTTAIEELDQWISAGRPENL